jgi:DNA-binding NarL/FixJ family response regulator
MAAKYLDINVVVAQSPEEALGLLQTDTHVVITGLLFYDSKMDGGQLLAAIKERNSKVIRVICSDLEDDPNYSTSIAAGEPHGTYRKPCDIAQMIEQIKGM